MKYVPSSKRNVYIFLSITSFVSVVLTLILLPYMFDYEATDRDFNAFLKYHDMRNSKVIVNSVGKETTEITSASAIISRHAYSYKDGGDNLILPWFIDIIIRPMIEEVTRAQYETLKQQVDNGVKEFDVRLSKLNDGSIVVDHGFVYGTAKEFMNDLENCNIGTNTVKVHFRSSGYSPQRISSVEIENELRKHHTNTQIELHHSDYNDWAFVDSDDYMEIITTLNNNKQYKVLTVYRSAGEIIRISAIILFAAFFVLLILGWIVYMVTVNSKNEE